MVSRWIVWRVVDGVERCELARECYALISQPEDPEPDEWEIGVYAPSGLQLAWEHGTRAQCERWLDAYTGPFA